MAKDGFKVMDFDMHVVEPYIASILGSSSGTPIIRYWRTTVETRQTPHLLVTCHFLLGRTRLPFWSASITCVDTLMRGVMAPVCFWVLTP